MGNFLCPVDDISHLTSVARDICPFPNYHPSPLFNNMLSINSSLHLRDHYKAVQSSLTPKQLEDFTKRLRSTFGREGKVTLGGMGVVALSLAVLFDTLAKQVKGEWVSDSGPIPGLFVKNLRGYYPPQVYTVSEYLRLVPHIANNPTRMREETERYLKRLKFEDQPQEALSQNGTLSQKEDTTILNLYMTQVFTNDLRNHLIHINGTDVLDEVMYDMNQSADDVFFNLNCDPNTADQKFLSEVQTSDNHTQEAFKKFIKDPQKSLVLQAAMTEFAFVILQLTFCERKTADSIFDLKFNALGKWAN